MPVINFQLLYLSFIIFLTVICSKSSECFNNWFPHKIAKKWSPVDNTRLYNNLSNYSLQRTNIANSKSHDTLYWIIILNHLFLYQPQNQSPPHPWPYLIFLPQVFLFFLLFYLLLFGFAEIFSGFSFSSSLLLWICWDIQRTFFSIFSYGLTDTFGRLSLILFSLTDLLRLSMNFLFHPPFTDSLKHLVNVFVLPPSSYKSVKKDCKKKTCVL